MEQTATETPASENVENTTRNNIQSAEEYTPDLSAYFKDGEAGVFDAEKIADLARSLENQKKSTSYFQSQFMKKNGVPETVEGYYTHFKPDSMYEKAFNEEGTKESIDTLFKWAKENNIGEREATLFADYALKSAVESNLIDMRTDEQKQAEQEKLYMQEAEKVKPMLENLGRSIDENNKVIENFLNSRSVFTNNPEMVEYIRDIADKDAMGYMFVTMLTQAIEHKGIPVVTGSATGSKDKAAFEKAFQEEPDPVKREALARAFYGE